MERQIAATSIWIHIKNSNNSKYDQNTGNVLWMEIVEISHNEAKPSPLKQRIIMMVIMNTLKKLESPLSQHYQTLI